MKDYKLLLFDLDETLLSGDWFKEGIIQMIQSHALTKHIDPMLFLEKKLQVPKPLITRFKNRELSPHEFRRARWKHALSYFEMFPEEEVIDELDGCFLQSGMSCIKENKNLTALLDDLQKHYQLAIVTNALYDPMMKISSLKLSHLFTKDNVFQAEELGYRKPDPELYWAALNHFQNLPEQAVFIGDSWTHDVVGPMEMGMEAIWVNENSIPIDSAHRPLKVVSEILELRSVLL
ncbi:HAD family hydrolase [Falsibacillus pallidus]|uniref:Putative hydrolase of the HAD superfamily n=1 Tax=Falsibacillus pallidus TaxID=493781 RepID=A0A370G2S9_9BACI|nr:HAD family hydrolase [Falsibacillus pallidus]RDI36904.1 putative hydrolase of the HAD superfamily [Falsibacillus pallidus]